MLRKLIKHEWRATRGFLGLICLGLLAFAGITRLFVELSSLVPFFRIPMTITLVLYILLLVASSAVTLVILIKRYYDNLYGAEGYITLTLPVRRSSLILSKLLVGLAWMLISTLTVMLSIFILLAFNSYMKDAFAVIGEGMRMLMNIFTYGNAVPGWVMIAELVLISLIGLVFNLLSLYAAVSFGQLFKKRRLLGSFLGYMIVYTVSQTVMNGYLFVVSLTQGDYMAQGSQALGILAFNSQINVVLYIVMMLLLCAGCYLTSLGVLKKAVNLQ